MKSIYSLVNDIYEVVSTKKPAEGVDLDAAVEQFGENVKTLMRGLFEEPQGDKRNLRMSNIGRQDRFLWNVVNNQQPVEELKPYTYVKFLYGHLIEEMLLFLTRVAGHEVTDEQKRCEVNGIKGSMDCKIDGVVTDVKSVSSFGFKKFKDGTMAYDDPFGYVAQIKAYAHSEGETKFGWLAMDKQNGHLTYLMYDQEDTQAPVYEKLSFDISERIEHIKEMVKQPEPPKVCYEPVPDGKSGNMKLTTGCSYCQYKRVCYPELRAFLYSGGPRFLTVVENEPKVQEIPLEEIE